MTLLQSSVAVDMALAAAEAAEDYMGTDWSRSVQPNTRRNSLVRSVQPDNFDVAAENATWYTLQLPATGGDAVFCCCWVRLRLGSSRSCPRSQSSLRQNTVLA